MLLLRSQPFLPLPLALVCATSAGAQTAAPFRSAVHRYKALPQQTSGQFEASRTAFWDTGLALTATNGSTAWYSAGVNRVLCSLLLPDQTWLGTAFGIKRLDLAAHTTRHYTTLDGLPYPLVTALATNGRAIFCASVRQTEIGKPEGASALGRAYNAPVPRDAAVALCRFDAQTARWKVVAEVKREPDRAGDQRALRSPLARTAPSELLDVPAQWIAVNSSSACLVAGPCLPGKDIALLYPLQSTLQNTGESTSRSKANPAIVERIAAPDFLKTPFVPTAVQLDDTFLWLGTLQGLLRCDLRTRRWDTLLPDAAVFGGVGDGAGGVWVLARTAEPFENSREQGLTRQAHWSLAHFAPGQPPRSYPVKEGREAQNEWEPGWLENITLADNKVWMTVNLHITSGDGGSVYPPDVYSLDPSTGLVKLEAAGSDNKPDEYFALPDRVLAQSHTGWGTLTPLALPSRFPGWTCATESREAALLQLARDGDKTQDAQSRSWDVDWGQGARKGRFLHRRTDQNVNADEDYYALPNARFAVHDDAACPIAVGDKIYFLSGTYSVKLWAWDTHTDRVEAVAWANAVLKSYRSDSSNDRTMLAGKDCVWIGTGDDVLRCGLDTRHVDTWHGDTRSAQSSVPRCALLGVEGDTAWVKIAPNHLYTANLSHPSELSPTALPPFPGELERVRDKMILFTLEGHVAWFTARYYMTRSNRPLIGYDLRTQTWTQPRDVSLPFHTEGGTLAAYRQEGICWFPAASGEASAYGYESARGRWTTLPPLPAKHEARQVLAVDGRNAWVCDDASIYHLDRVGGMWDARRLPFYVSPFHDIGRAQIGPGLYVATSAGITRYDTATKQITPSPRISLGSEDMDFRVMSVDAKAVWVMVYQGDACFAARFDRAAQTWRHWSVADGLPPRFDLMIGDGQSCWLRSQGLLYHLDTRTNRWDNISRRLAAGIAPRSDTGRDHGSRRSGKSGNEAGGGELVPIKQIMVDGVDVWLVSGAYHTIPPGMSSSVMVPVGTRIAAAAPLYRYNISTRQITPVYPAPRRTLTPNWFVASKRSLLLAAVEGVYRLNRAGGAWQAVPLPALPAGFPVSSPFVAREDGNDVWVVGVEELRYGVQDALRLRRTPQ